jgi:hypothetical protein
MLEPRKPAIVLSADERVKYPQSASSLNSRAVSTTTNVVARGVCVAAGQKVTAINSARRAIVVRQSKGGRGRNATPSPRSLATPRAKWKLPRPTTFLFFGTRRRSGDRFDRPSRVSVSAEAAVLHSCAE